MTVPGGSPLNYPPGSQPPVKRVALMRAPTSNDSKNFREGDEWLDKSSNDWYKLADITGIVALWVRVGGSNEDVKSITTPDAVVVLPTVGNINFVNGDGISMTGIGDSVTVTSLGTSITWTVITTATATLVKDTGVFTNNAGLVTLTLPVTASGGDTYIVASVNAGGWKIDMNAGQTIHYGVTNTTITTGTVLSTKIGDSITLTCYIDNTDFIINQSFGNIDIT